MILLYKGKSFISWRIKMGTLSRYSHVAWLKADAETRASLRDVAHHHHDLWPQIRREIIDLGCIEAWAPKVRETDSLSDGHKPGTVIDIFDPVSVEEFKFPLIEEYMRERVGDEYWFGGILWARLNRYNQHEPPENKWFCSQLVESALRAHGCPTTDERIPARGVWPGSLGRSVLTSYLGSVTI